MESTNNDAKISQAMAWQQMNGWQKRTLEALAVLVAMITMPSAEAQEIWTRVGSGDRPVSLYIDMGSHRLLPNGVTVYKEQVRATNPITGQLMNIDRTRGIDCKTKEIVYVADGKREAYGTKKIKEILQNCPGSQCTSYAIAFANFCPSGTLK